MYHDFYDLSVYLQKRIREAVEYNELEEEKGGDQPTLQIVDTDKFSNDATDGQINGHAVSYCFIRNVWKIPSGQTTKIKYR